MAWHLCADQEVHLFSPLSKGSESDLLIKHIQEQGIQFIGPRLNGEIPHQKIELREDGEKIFSPFNHGVLKMLPELKMKLDYKKFDVVMGPVHRETLPFFESFLQIKRTDQKLFLDFTTLKEFDYRPNQLSTLIQNAELMQFSPSEDQQNLVEKIKSLKLNKDQVLLLTLGAKGGFLKMNDHQENFLAPLIEKVTDTTGAGDAFFSSFANLFLLKSSLERCLDGALAASKSTISRIGSTPLQLNN